MATKSDKGSAKKSAAKTTVKKAEVKKTTAKSPAAAAKTVAKKTEAKKVVEKKAAETKAVEKKAVAKKAATIKAVEKKTEKKNVIEKTQTNKKAAMAKKTEKKVEKPVETPKPEKVQETKPVSKHEESVYVEITSPKKVVRKIKGYGKEDLEFFKKIILEKRSEILEQLDNLREQMMDPTTGQYVNENSPYSLHMAEQGTDAMEREKLYLYAQRENKFLSYLDDALHRIENGTYGICIECIDEPQNLCPTCPLISKERLAAVPHSQLCLPVKQKQEKK